MEQLKAPVVLPIRSDGIKDILKDFFENQSIAKVNKIQIDSEFVSISFEQNPSFTVTKHLFKRVCKGYFYKPLKDKYDDLIQRLYYYELDEKHQLVLAAFCGIGHEKPKNLEDLSRYLSDNYSSQLEYKTPFHLNMYLRKGGKKLSDGFRGRRRDVDSDIFELHNSGELMDVPQSDIGYVDPKSGRYYKTIVSEEPGNVWEKLESHQKRDVLTGWQVHWGW